MLVTHLGCRLPHLQRMCKRSTRVPVCIADLCSIISLIGLTLQICSIPMYDCMLVPAAEKECLCVARRPQAAMLQSTGVHFKLCVCSCRYTLSCRMLTQALISSCKLLPSSALYRHMSCTTPSLNGYTLKHFCTSCTDGLCLVDPVFKSVLLKKSFPILLAKRLLMSSSAALADSYPTKEKTSSGLYLPCAAQQCCFEWGPQR